MNCPICDKPLVKDSGIVRAKILMIGECVGQEEIHRGYVFCGETGRILEREMARVGLSSNVMMTNLWLHEKPEKFSDLDKQCYQYFVSTLLSKLANYDAILLMGADLVTLFQPDYTVSEVCGLRLESILLPKNSVVVAAPNPAIVMHGSVGEFRLALRKFKRLIGEKK